MVVQEPYGEAEVSKGGAGAGREVGPGLLAEESELVPGQKGAVEMPMGVAGLLDGSRPEANGGGVQEGCEGLLNSGRVGVMVSRTRR